MANLIGIGFEEFFYLYNLTTTESFQIKMNGYFGQIYCVENGFLVCSASNVICIDSNGNVKWICNNLGVDGVIIEEIKEEIVIGSGEWDPPGGWRQFKIFLKTGEIIS